jgi:hypothetical protein
MPDLLYIVKTSYHMYIIINNKRKITDKILCKESVKTVYLHATQLQTNKMYQSKTCRQQLEFPSKIYNK